MEKRIVCKFQPFSLFLQTEYGSAVPSNVRHTDLFHLIILHHIMEINLKDIIKELYTLPAYQKLGEYYKQDNIFSILHKERSETIHSSFLAWLLDAQKLHGLGDKALRYLLRLYATKCKDEEEKEWANTFLLGNYYLDGIRVETEKSTSMTQKTAEKDEKKGRMDIYAEAELQAQEDNQSTRTLMLCIENKIYSTEHDKQTEKYHKYLTERSKNHDESNPLLVEIYLTPQEEDKPLAKTFVTISYKEVLHNILEPLLNISEITESAKCYIQDYIRALGRPSFPTVDSNDNASDDKGQKRNTVLAVSRDEAESLAEIAENTAFRMAYMANQDKDEGFLKATNGWDTISVEDVQNNRDLLNQLWISNNDLFEAAAIHAGLELNPEQSETNRDNSRYIVKYNDEVLNFKNKNGSLRLAAKAETAYLIFKAWCIWWKENHEGEKPSFEDINAAFPLQLNNYYGNGKYFTHLFIKEVRFEGTKSHKDIRLWNIFNDDNHYLELKEGNYLSLKMWRKADFERLLERIKNKLPQFTQKLEII